MSVATVSTISLRVFTSSLCVSPASGCWAWIELDCNVDVGSLVCKTVVVQAVHQWGGWQCGVCTHNDGPSKRPSLCLRQGLELILPLPWTEMLTPDGNVDSLKR